MTQTIKNATVHNNKGDLFASFDVADFDIPQGKDEVWRFIPLRRVRGLHNDTFPEQISPDIQVVLPEGAAASTRAINKDEEVATRAGAPVDRVAAQAWTSAADLTLVSVARGAIVEKPIEITVTGRGQDRTSFGGIVIDIEPQASATVVLRYRGLGVHADNVQINVGDGAHLALVTDADWERETVHLSAHSAAVGRDAVLRHSVGIFGGEVVRIQPRVKFLAPGGDAELHGVYFADDGQYFESRLLVDHAVPNCRSKVLYKGALQGDPTSERPDTHTTWVGDVLIRADALNTDTYETNRNLVLSDAARADAVPNLEIETGQIVGAGHAATVGRFDDEQLFYLMARGIPEVDARRLIIHGFFTEVINHVPVKSVREDFERRVTQELERVTL